MNFESIAGFLLGIDLIAKATIVLVAVAVIDLFLNKSAAALRHRLWTTALIGLLLLPLVSVSAPNFRLSVVPKSWLANLHDAASIRFLNDATKREAPDATSATINLTQHVPSSGPSFDEATEPRVAIENSLPISRELSNVPAQKTRADSPRPLRSNVFGIGSTALEWCIILWGLGVFVSLTPLFFGMTRNFMLYRSSTKITGTGINDLLEESRQRLRVARSVELRSTPEAIMPMTWGAWRPIVLMPEDAWKTWNSKRCRFVLLHELAHIKRLDVIYQTLARFTCAIYWFHPLARYALRRLRVERELACDDCVVMAGERASEYAQQLVSIAKQYRSLALPPASAMAQRSGLEQRVRAMLDRARSHMPLSSTTAFGMLLAVLLTVTALAVLKLDTNARATQVAANGNVTTTDAATPDDSSKHILRVAGTVFNPDGKPVSGARVYVLRQFLSQSTWNHSHEILAELTTNALGQYSTIVPSRSNRFSDGYNLESQSTRVMAFQPGFGVEEVAVDLAHSNKTDLRLPRTTIPIVGQLVDLEGRPVANARVSLQEIVSTSAPLQEWVEQAKNTPASLPAQSMSNSPTVDASDRSKVIVFPARERMFAMNLVKPIETLTDLNGRFKLDAIGDDRKATLRIESPDIATTLLQVVTREMPPVNDPYWDPRFRAGKIFGNQFVYSVEPTQWISGTISDRKTGTPISGVKVSLSQFADELLGINEFIVTETDSAGRYTLKGVPKASASSRAVQLQILPSKDQPYFRSRASVPKSTNWKELKLDLQLTQGIWIEGQVVDSQTNEGVQAMIAYYPNRDNELAKNHEAWDAGLRTVVGDNDSFPTDSQGRFRVPGMTGPGVLRVVANADYKYSHNELSLEQASRKYYHIGRHGNAMIDLNLDSSIKNHRVSVSLEPRQSKIVQVVDMSGQGLYGYQVGGSQLESDASPSGRSSSYWNNDRYASSKCEIIIGGETNMQRPLFFFHSAKSLGAIVPLSELIADKNSPARITLKPCAKITGTIVADAQKTPASGYVIGGVGVRKVLGMRPRPGGSYDMVESKAPHYGIKYISSIKKDGTVEYFLPPGKGLSLIVQQHDHSTIVLEDVELKPGEELDFGTINLSLDRKEWPALKRNQNKSDTTARFIANELNAEGNEPVSKPADKKLNFRGRVQLPDGKPAAGAKLYFVHWDHGKLPSNQIVPQAITRNDGSFDFDSPMTDISQHSALAAALPGFGMSAQPSLSFETTGGLNNFFTPQGLAMFGKILGQEAVLKLASDDQPLSGRVVNLEGQPVAGARIRLKEIAWNHSGNLDQWHVAARLDKADFYSVRNQASVMFNGYQLPSIVPDVQTDEQGNFTMHGIGRERIVELLVSGQNIETKIVHARTRSGESIRLPQQFGWKDGPGLTYYANGFTHVAASSIPVNGQIVDHDTGTPVPGVLVTAGRMVTFTSMGKPYIATTTDAQGRYRLEGLSLQGEDTMYVVPPMDQKYLPLGIRPKLSRTREPMTVDLKLKRALLLKGRVLDSVSGKPIKGSVKYFAEPGNPNLALHAQFRFAAEHEARTNAAGEYAITVLPGKGYLTFMADDHTRFRRAAESQFMQNSTPMIEAVPGFLSAAHVHFLEALEIDESLIATGYVIKLSSGNDVQLRLVNADGKPVRAALVKGTGQGSGWFPLKSDSISIQGYYAEAGREIFVYDQETEEGAYLKVKGQITNPITVRLEPTSIVRGRLLDSSGLPRAGVEFIGETFPQDNSGNVSLRTVSDEEGRFELRGFATGVKHTILAKQGTSLLNPEVAKNLEFTSRQIRDLGDIVLQSP